MDRKAWRQDQKNIAPPLPRGVTWAPGNCREAQGLRLKTFSPVLKTDWPPDFSWETYPD